MSKVTIKTVAGRTFDVECDGDQKIVDLKAVIAEKHGYDEEGLKLVVNGTVVADDTTVDGANLKEQKFVVLVAKKKTVRAQTEELKQKEKQREEKEKEKVVQPTPVDAPSGPLNEQQIAGMIQLQGLMQAKVRNMNDFVDLLRFHGTVTEIRTLIQGDQTLLAPVLYQINYHAPQLLSAINQYQQEFLQIINEPVPRRPATGGDSRGGVGQSLDEGLESYMNSGGHEVVYITPEEDEAIQRLCQLGFPHQVAAEAFIVCNRREDLAADYLFEMLDQPGGSAGSEWLPDEDEESRRESLKSSIELESSSALDEPSQAYAKLQQALVVQGKFEEALLVAEQSRVAVEDGDALDRKIKSLALSRASEPSSEYALQLSDIRRIATDADAHVVYYSILPVANLAYIWIIPKVSTKKIEFHQMSIDVEAMSGGVVTLGRSLAKDSGINPKTSWRRILRQLHTVLIEPIASLLPSDDSENLCFIPAPGPMAKVPFSALVAADNSYLIAKHSVVMALSFAMLGTSVHFAGRQRPSGAQPFCIGKDDELAVYKDLLKAEVVAPSAQSRLAKACIIHAHSQTALKDVAVSSELPIELVVASSCRQGTTDLNEDVFSGARSLTAGGAASVLLPLWVVDDEAEDPLLQSFYKEVLQGTKKAAALRQAMLQRIEQDDGKMWTWAGWSLFGVPGSLADIKEPTSTTEKPKKKTKGKKKGEIRRTEDYKYLKEHRIHVLYEKLVRELLCQKPEDVPSYVLTYMQQHQVDLQNLMAGKQNP